jgi:retron-type reverse transcriptase
MKRKGNLYAEICDPENIKVAFENAIRGKSGIRTIREISKNPDPYLKETHDILKEERFVNGKYNTFQLKERGKDRVIHSLPFFPDRIIHHAIVQVCGPIWIKSFIRDTYASIPGRGIHDGVRRIKRIMPQCKGWYALKCDITKFYPSVDHTILKTLLRKQIKDKPLLRLFDTIIDSAPGIPIGNYLSQYFGNIILSSFDQWIKHKKKVKYYFRYCDDFVVIAKDKHYLHELRIEIEAKLNELKLRLKGNWQVFPVSARGIDFLGYRFWPHKTLIRRTTIQRFKERLKIKRMTLNEAIRLAHVTGSFKGWLRYADSARLINKYVLPSKSRVKNYLRQLRHRLSQPPAS